MERRLTPEERKIIRKGKIYKKEEPKSEKWWKAFVTNLVQREDEALMKEVNSIPKLRDAQAPPEMREKLFAQIIKYENNKKDSKS